jgi:8-oxo-dGTP pyrophosphatase MutT (NUDIX family)
MRGALVVVYRRGERGLEYLVLHRGHSGPAYEGDWAWGPPGGAREAGESVDECARRELLEETGLALGCVYLWLDASDLPLFWRLDLDVRGASARPDEPRARGEDWSPAESALANAVAAVKAELRARPAEAAALLGRGFDRVGLPPAEGATHRRIAVLAAAVSAAEPSLARLAVRVAALADRHLPAR